MPGPAERRVVALVLPALLCELAEQPRVAGQRRMPLGVVLEGGYDLDALTSSLLATLREVSAEPSPGAPESPIVDGVANVARRVAERLPASMDAG